MNKKLKLTLEKSLKKLSISTTQLIIKQESFLETLQMNETFNASEINKLEEKTHKLAKNSHTRHQENQLKRKTETMEKNEAKKQIVEEPQSDQESTEIKLKKNNYTENKKTKTNKHENLRDDENETKEKNQRINQDLRRKILDEIEKMDNDSNSTIAKEHQNILNKPHDEKNSDHNFLEEKYPRHRNEVIITGQGLNNYKDIYSRIKELKRCTGIDDPQIIHPTHDVEKEKYFLNIAANTYEKYTRISGGWSDNAFSNGVKTTDKPPNLMFIINNIEKNINIDQNKKQLIELTRQYGLIDIERIYSSDKTPTNKIKSNVLTLFNFLTLLRNGIYLDVTSMKHTVKPLINYAKVYYKCGSLNHNQKDCKNK
ncbi:unnamed protein product [Brachionus calyciflorus]|uniref:Uncharacterized protein n=1 Tax=Brachionus calyciflorus TaxID=104777 RepID=A0A814B302_9BILA|nr:unnamed protein product [Brachionus calyciflorus]